MKRVRFMKRIDALLLIDSKGDNSMDEREELLPIVGLLPMNGFAGRDTLCWTRPVGNIPKFMPLDNSLNR